MLSRDTKLEIKKSGDFPLIPEGKYTVQIMEVDLIRQMNAFKGKEEDMLKYRFAILNDVIDDTNADGQNLRGQFLFRRCCLSINPKSWLGLLLKAVYGRELSDEEVNKFFPTDIVGHQVDVLVGHNEGKDGRTYANILTFSPNKKTLPTLEAEAKEPEVKKSQPNTKDDNAPPWEA